MKFGEEYFNFCKDDNGCDFNAKGGWQKQYAEFIADNFNSKNVKCLDFGCALGANTSALKDIGFDMYGIDVSEWYVENSKFENLKGKLFSYDINKCDLGCFEDDMFDMIHSQQVIEHIEEKNIPKVFQELNRVLKQGGLFYVATVEEDANGIESEPTHYSCLSKKKWIEYFKKAGFKNVTNNHSKILNGKMATEYCWVQFVFKKV